MQIKRVKYSDLEVTRQLFGASGELKEDFFGSAPAPFVGRYGYPNVNVGILAPQRVSDDAWILDAPRAWAKHSYTINQVLGFRSSLVNSRFKSDVKSPDKLVAVSQEVAMAAKPVDVEVHLTKKPTMHQLDDYIVTPMGPQASLKSVRVTENAKVERKVEKVVGDTDLKAAEAVQYLYKNDFDENNLSRLLSVGTLGLGKNRKLVPTRWSITAVDDTLGKQLITTIKDHPTGGYHAYFGGHLGNYFLVLFLDDIWGYELFEIYTPAWTKDGELKYSTDHEFFEGRKTYAEETAGGYYASRLPILDTLAAAKRQGRVLVLRFITDEYTVPLGVWVVREAVRKAMSAKPLEFGSQELLLQYAAAFVKAKFGIDAGYFFERSELLTEQRSQKKLGTYFS